MTVQIQMPPSRLLLLQEQGNAWNIINGSKRGQLEILADILVFCNKEKVKTKIMYANNLNYVTLQNYLKLLTSRGLLVLENGKYVTTEKGFVFIDLFMGIHDILANE